ncbi:DNA/RNA helicase [Chromohalobacter japonicus]|uniref:DNA/RNA helicase n=1 Tax=Chromohalobacter japonicus TaxID=223900 RepID=A0A1Q8T9T2_9GAMM|nr:ATP-dependent helicase [Chromohalobacter japonicus]OLO10435.1 DNA/RNA helicase [Chromohalobacter japonicus]
MNEWSEETRCILGLVRSKNCFLLSGGAGSGKTYTLVETIRALTQLEPSSRIACITYTNAAADEIRDRAGARGLWVSTIHDFMWENIKRHQTELKQVLRELIQSDDPTLSRFTISGADLTREDIINDLVDEIKYREYVKIKDGIISHDEVLILASRMFERYPKLCRIVGDLHNHIFVDEYQDTSPLVVKILLDSVRSAASSCVIGFFGDAMQAIYPGTVGSLHDRVETKEITEIKKEQNRRNPQLVIDLANQIRTDGIEQHPSDDPAAPNMFCGSVCKGVIRFMYSSSASIEKVREKLSWEVEGSKELNLTHNLIASQAGFGKLMEAYDGDKILAFVKRIKNYLKENVEENPREGSTFGEVVDALQAGKKGSELNRVSPTPAMQTYIDDHPADMKMARETLYEKISRIYVSKDQLLDDTKDSPDAKSRPGSQRDELIQHLFRIQGCIHAYQDRKYSEFIRLTDFSLRSAADKVFLRDAISKLAGDEKNLIGDVIEQAEVAGLIKKDDRLIRFQEEKAYIYARVARLLFSEFQNLYGYLEGHTPFSTQHKTKGREYQRVLVVLDNGGWNNYNFKNLFEGVGSDSVRERTSKIFYVCCTRAMEELAVFYHNPTDAVITKAKEWFGDENVVNLDAS